MVTGSMIDGRELPAHRVFFPLAMALAAVVVPAWAALYRDRPDLAPWHAHEMLFGYGFAVVAGFLLARLRWQTLAALIAAWLAARAGLALGNPAVGAIGALGFVLAVAGIAAQRFLRAARKGRNRVFAVILLAMAAAETLFQAGTLGLLGDGEQRGILLMLDLLTLIMLQMGGRVIPAATAGALQRRGIELKNRVQPRLEAAIAVAMLAMMLADQIPGLARVGGIAAACAAALAAVRMARWRGWLARGDPALTGLHVAYAWLVCGLALKAGAALGAEIPAMAGVHALGIGGLGTMTTVMMLRTTITRESAKHGFPPRIAAIIVALIAVAALLRIVGTFLSGPGWLIGAAAAWTVALLLALAVTCRTMLAGPLVRAR
jgi:uncharacterized protein involved in response to NO